MRLKINSCLSNLQRHLLASISPTNLRADFTSVVPKSVRASQVVSIFLRFWDLRKKAVRRTLMKLSPGGQILALYYTIYGLCQIKPLAAWTSATKNEENFGLNPTHPI